MYDKDCTVREEDVAEFRPSQALGYVTVNGWKWISRDSGAWEGPRRDWECGHKNIIKEHVTDWRICVQAGGNQGMYPRLLSDMFKHVYTFEPDPLNFHCLVANCQKDNIYKLNAGLGKETGLCKVIPRQSDNTGTYQISVDDNELYVPLMTVDSLNLPHCGFIMFDVEKFEHDAILGSINTIEKYKPVIQLETVPGELHNLLTNIGYEKVGESHADKVYKVV